MSKQYIDIFPFTIIAKTAVKQHRFITAKGAHGVTNSKEVVGVSRIDAEVGQPILNGAVGAYTCTAGEAIAVGDPIKCGAAGRAAKGARGTADEMLLNIGTALEAAAEVEDEFQVLLK